jgi:signal transduction histidine kinase
MFIKRILKKLDPMADCRRYGLGFLQCPNSLFLVMGGIIIVAMVLTYWIGIQFIDPELIIIIVSAVTIVLLIIGHSLVNSFTRVAEANRMKSEFVSIVSHQLRTPLSALKWSLDLLRSKRLGEINEKQKEYLDIVNDSGDKMIRLVNDLLNVSRIEQGRFTIQPKSFAIDEMVSETIREFEAIASVNNIRLSLVKDKDLPNVFADQDKIRMVIQNLIDNAIKYSKKGGGLVIITAERDKEKDKKIKLSVKDDGTGIPFFMQKHVFGKFFRGENLIKQKVEGTGLGLFIARGIVKISNGEIGFKSEEGKGSIFWFTLPVANN